MIPQDLVGIVEGMNATIQVVTSGPGDEGGGLYNVCICPAVLLMSPIEQQQFKIAFANMVMVLKCADITLSSTAPSGPCVNDTGVTAVGYGGPYKNANGTDGAYETPSPTGSVIAAPTLKGAARKAELGFWALIVGAIMASLLL